MRSIVFRRIALAVATGGLLACASSGSSGSTPRETTSGRRDRSQITADDMKDLAASNLYDVVQRIHPEWLNARNSTSVGGSSSRSMSSTDQGVQVYIDMQRAGNSDVLKQLPISGAASLKFYTASEAQARFGNGNLNGAIQIVSVTGKP